MTGNVLVLNADYSLLNTTSWQRAVSLVYQGKAEVIELTEKMIEKMKPEMAKLSSKVLSNFEGTYKLIRPLVIRLLKSIRQIYKSKVPYSKRNVISRDESCVYCGTKKDLTIDHVIPKMLGGKTSWDNCVASCKKCNNKKGHKTLREANMFLKKQPYQPTIAEFMQMKLKQMGFDKFVKELFANI